MGKALDRFTVWFCSGAGVLQTALVCLAIVVVELCDRSLDPHAFILLAVLTVYSAVTQPALAYSTARSADAEGALVVELRALLLQIMANEDRIAEVADRVETVDKLQGSQLAEILDVLHNGTKLQEVLDALERFRGPNASA